MPIATLSSSSKGARAIPVFKRSIGSWRFSVERQPFDTSALRGHYDRVAESWQNRLDRLGMQAAYKSIVQDALRHDMPRGVMHVLDCGIGTGAMSLALTQVAHTPLAIDGVDVSPAMLQCAERRLAKTDALLHLRTGDVCALGGEDSSFDLVMAAHVLEHVSDPALAIAELVRVTRPGGRIVLCLTRRSALGFLIQTRWRTHRFAPAQVQRLMRDAGLVEVRRLDANSYAFDALSTAWVAVKPKGDVR